MEVNHHREEKIVREKPTHMFGSSQRTSELPAAPWGYCNVKLYPDGRREYTPYESLSEIARQSWELDSVDDKHDKNFDYSSSHEFVRVGSRFARKDSELFNSVVLKPDEKIEFDPQYSPSDPQRIVFLYMPRMTEEERRKKAEDRRKKLQRLKDRYFEDEKHFQSRKMDPRRSLYDKQVDESKGFDVDNFPDSLGFGLIVPLLQITPELNQKLICLANLALTGYNTNHGTNFKFVKIIKANSQVRALGHLFYITFEVKPGDALLQPNHSPTQNFQAKVWTGPSDPGSVQFIRPKPDK